MSRLCTLIVCGAPLASRSPQIARSLVAAGWRVRPEITPAAAEWVSRDVLGVAAKSLQGRGDPLPRERPDALVIAPITFNTVAKLALGIADTSAHSMLCEALAEAVPVLAVPTVNQRLWGHPAWTEHCKVLSASGVQWLGVEDGTIGEPRAVRSGAGDALVERFDPAWIVAQVGRLVEIE